jgi:mannose-6-phosphate isomerase-like protein (cupin superfamily)
MSVKKSADLIGESAPTNWASSVADAASELDGLPIGSRFVELFHHGTLSVEYYRPIEADLQSPHSRDEIYVVASGSGEFTVDGVTRTFRAGDAIFVAAGRGHRFERFSSDFATWVFFYGPEGGEVSHR